MIVYIVLYYDYGPPQILGVFSTSEQAEAFVAKRRDKETMDIIARKIDDLDWEEAEPEPPE